MFDVRCFGTKKSARKIPSNNELMWSISFQPQNFGRVASSTLARLVNQLTRMKWFVKLSGGFIDTSGDGR